jgi:hypothetical protein
LRFRKRQNFRNGLIKLYISLCKSNGAHILIRLGNLKQVLSVTVLGSFDLSFSLHFPFVNLDFEVLS